MTCFRLDSGETMIDYCRRNNLSYNTMYNRIDRGMTPEEAVKTPIRKNHGAMYYDVDGKTFHSKMTHSEYQLFLVHRKKIQ